MKLAEVFNATILPTTTGHDYFILIEGYKADGQIHTIRIRVETIAQIVKALKEHGAETSTVYLEDGTDEWTTRLQRKLGIEGIETTRTDEY